MYPIKTLFDNSIIQKPIIKWMKDENKNYEWNNKGLHSIIGVITLDEDLQISLGYSLDNA